MLTTYPEIRNRIYQLARERDLTVEWVELTKGRRKILLYDSKRLRVASADVVLRGYGRRMLAELAGELADVFGEGWLE
jgi:hypothetical protein